MQKLRENYEHLYTEELLEIAKKDLTDQARTVLNEVLASRNIDANDINASILEGARQKAKLIEENNRLASRWSRLVAFMIDVWGGVFCLYVLLLPVGLVSQDLYFSCVSLTWLGYVLLRDGMKKGSFGKRLMGIKVVRAGTDIRCSWLQSIARNASHIIFVIDALFILSDGRTRLGDLVSRTVVVNGRT